MTDNKGYGEVGLKLMKWNGKPVEKLDESELRDVVHGITCDLMNKERENSGLLAQLFLAREQLQKLQEERNSKIGWAMVLTWAGVWLIVNYYS